MNKTDINKKKKMKNQETTNIFIDEYTSSNHSHSSYTPLSSSLKSSDSDSEYLQNQNYQRKSQNAKASSSKYQSRSVHHNSQKHAVTTFKHMIDFPYAGQQSAVHQLAKQIWKIFLHSKGGKNKELLSIVFGCQQSEEKRIFKKFKLYGFGQVLQNDYRLIKDAQNLLRNLVIEQMTPQRFQKHLKSRKMTQKEGFRLYMLNLIQELSNGPIQRRLAKQKSQGIVSLVQVDKMLSLSDEA